ncbi:MAG: hypothetical protein EOO65_00115 [Methanosarcinales archaeon]|nr:MAG: hypothetical protein EOO65_00115 [Methanosarcinales archaeon]
MTPSLVSTASLHLSSAIILCHSSYGGFLTPSIVRTKHALCADVLQWLSAIRTWFAGVVPHASSDDARAALWASAYRSIDTSYPLAVSAADTLFKDVEHDHAALSRNSQPDYLMRNLFGIEREQGAGVRAGVLVLDTNKGYCAQKLQWVQHLDELDTKGGVTDVQVEKAARAQDLTAQYATFPADFSLLDADLLLAEVATERVQGAPPVSKFQVLLKTGACSCARGETLCCHAAAARMAFSLLHPDRVAEVWDMRMKLLCAPTEWHALVTEARAWKSEHPGEDVQDAPYYARIAATFRAGIADTRTAQGPETGPAAPDHDVEAEAAQPPVAEAVVHSAATAATPAAAGVPVVAPNLTALAPAGSKRARKMTEAAVTGHKQPAGKRTRSGAA